MGQKFSDAARAELSTPIDGMATTLVIKEGGELFPVADTGINEINSSQDWFKLVLQDSQGYEVVYCRTHAEESLSFSNLLRGQEGTVARSFNSNAVVGLRPTARNAEVWEAKEDAVDTRKIDNFVAEPNKSYWLRDSFEVTLPDTTNLVIGDRVSFSKALGAIPTIQVGPGGAEIETEKGISTAILFDMNAEISLVFNGTNWEL